MAEQTIYTVGGTVQAGGGIYISRRADDDLLNLCRAGEMAFILSSRQVGKSSLIVRTARKLESEGIRSVMVDLSGIGVTVSQDEWYLGILNEVVTTLDLQVDIFIWWAQYARLSHAQRLINFFHDILLKEIRRPVVLFFDEIDSTLSIRFADDFFAALRAVYNGRSQKPHFKRLSFVLVGVATPSDLISDNRRTPFNIGQRVDLTDFTLEEAMPLAQGLGINAKKVLAWVFEWSGGHPYLTQRLCAHLSKLNSEINKQTVAQTVEQLFIGESGQYENNLQFVRDMLIKRSIDVRKVLNTYKEIRMGKKVNDDERSIEKAHLKISGVVNKKSGYLVPRNRIYERAFDIKWIRENMPSPVPRKVAIVSILAVVFALIIVVFFVYQDWVQTDDERAQSFEQGFVAARDYDNVQGELKNLAGLFELQGNYAERAIKLFYGLSQDQKTKLFELTNAKNESRDQVVVALGVYQTLGFETAVDKNGDILLAKISEAVGELNPGLAKETKAWLQGRAYLNEEKYVEARDALREATLVNSSNPALYYDLARANIALELYSNALDDLDMVLRLDTNRTSAVVKLIAKNSTFSLYASQNRSGFVNLVSAFSFIDIYVDQADVSMIKIPEGTFVMGSEGGYSDSKPVHTISLSTYFIDQYEVTNKLYKSCVELGVCSAPLQFSSSTHPDYYNNSQFDNYPVVYVNWDMARSYCEWRGARLPTEAEWEKAARGIDGRTYPWGENIDCTYANFAVPPPGRICVGDTTVVGSYEKGQSSYGIFDMAGNVWEWVNDWYDESYYQISPPSNPTGPDISTYRVRRGGSWYINDNSVSTSYRGNYDPKNVSDKIGFRCALSP